MEFEGSAHHRTGLPFLPRVREQECVINSVQCHDRLTCSQSDRAQSGGRTFFHAIMARKKRISRVCSLAISRALTSLGISHQSCELHLPMFDVLSLWLTAVRISKQVDGVETACARAGAGRRVSASVMMLNCFGGADISVSNGDAGGIVA